MIDVNTHGVDCIGLVFIPEDALNNSILVKEYKDRGFNFILEQGRDVIGLTTVQAKQLREALDNFIKEKE